MSRPTIARLVSWCALTLSALGLTGRAHADDDALVLMGEQTSFTNVVDSFDDDDVFDIDISVGYQRTWELGRVQRQDPTAPGDGRMSDHWVDIADYELTRNSLVFGLDVGIFRDLALYARLPLILSDDRTLTRVGGNDPMSFLGTGSDPRVPALFEVTEGGFRSPTRSGVDYMTAGLAWSILNQFRDPHVATWVLMLEGRFNLGDPMRACSVSAGTTSCPGRGAEGNVQPGVGRGTNALRIETRASYRYQYLEPYVGIAFQIEWPGSGDRFYLPSGNLAGFINQRPPILGRFTVGTAIIPWEDREHYQRFSIDLRIMGDYVSEGHDYSPLFDALGSSGNPYLTTANAETTDGSGRRVDFYGLTDTQSHGRFGGQVTLDMLAARYVRFTVAAGFYYSPPYVITQADACNPNVDPTLDDPRQGTCRSGIINPHHRPALDLPGQRFRMEGVTQIDLSAFVTAQF